MRKSLLFLGLAGILLAAGCEDSANNPEAENKAVYTKKPVYELVKSTENLSSVEVVGIPEGVSYDPEKGHIGIFLKDTIDPESVYCDLNSRYYDGARKAAAILNAAQRNNKSLILRGNYSAENKQIDVNEIEYGGYKLD